VIQKVVHRTNLEDSLNSKRDLAYCLSRLSVERVSSVDRSGKQVHRSGGARRGVIRHFVGEAGSNWGRRRDCPDSSQLEGYESHASVSKSILPKNLSINTR